MSVQARNAADALPTVVADAREIADEVIIGVDASSVDGTFGVAADLADVVYRFSHDEWVGPARMLPFDYATGDWILSLDADERLDENLPAVLPELIGDGRFTHYWFPRRWVIGVRPLEYLAEPPWVPDWQRRLFRNDRALVWKPPRIHSGYLVMGQGCHEARAPLLHYDLVRSSPEQLQAKLAEYRTLGSKDEDEVFWGPSDGVTRQPAIAIARARHAYRRNRRARVDPSVHKPFRRDLPPWGCVIENVQGPAHCRPRATVVFEVVVRNVGELAWLPSGLAGQDWPKLRLGCHLLDGDRSLIEYDGPRTLLPGIARAGEALRFIAGINAPATPDAYFVEWDMVSEGECWFEQCGSAPLRTTLNVV